MKWPSQIVLLLLLAGFAASAFSEEVEFPDEELARESVLPVFASRRDVLNRHVVTSQRFEVGLGGGLMINEPFYNDVTLTAHLGYHFNDLHGIAIEGIDWMPGLSSYGQNLKSDSQVNNWDASKAPHPLWGGIGNYEFTAYYGKVSLTKQTVMNLNLFVYGGLMYINMQGYNSFGGDIGLGQNFFLSPAWALRLDIRMLIYPGPNAAAENLTNGQNPPVSSYPTRIFFDNHIGLSFVFLL